MATESIGNGINTIELTESQGVGILAILGIAAATILTVFVVYVLVKYVFSALGFYKMAKNRGIKHAWISWIPIAQDYILGELVDDNVFGIGGAKWLLVIGALVIDYSNSYILTATDTGFLYWTLTILSLLFLIYSLGAFYKLYKGYSKHPVLFLVLTILIPFLGPIFIFAIRNHTYQPEGYDKE